MEGWNGAEEGTRISAENPSGKTKIGGGNENGSAMTVRYPRRKRKKKGGNIVPKRKGGGDTGNN